MARATTPDSPAPTPNSPSASADHPAVAGLDRFLSHVSHELRTPLSAILLWTRLLEDRQRQDPEEITEAVTALKSSAEELQLLIEDLVDSARVLNGSVKLEPQELRFRPCFESAVKAVQPLAAEREVKLELPTNVPDVRLEADPDRFAQVLRNLLRHAIEATPPHGEVQIATTWEDDELEIGVQDSGPGLPEDLASHIFDHFGLVATDERTAAGGVSLTVVRKLVELQHGRIRAESGQSPGTTIYVRFPADPDGAAATSQPSGSERSEGNAAFAQMLAGRKVLLIEDAAETRKALEVVLSDAGAAVWAVESSSAALAAFKANVFDLVISDLGLPKMDGYELMQQFRRWERVDGNRGVPALALTAFAGEGMRRRALQSGYNDCLTKPIDPVRLVAAAAALARPRT